MRRRDMEKKEIGGKVKNVSHRNKRFGGRVTLYKLEGPDGDTYRIGQPKHRHDISRGDNLVALLDDDAIANREVNKRIETDEGTKVKEFTRYWQKIDTYKNLGDKETFKTTPPKERLESKSLDVVSRYKQKIEPDGLKDQIQLLCNSWFGDGQYKERLDVARDVLSEE